MKRQKEERLKSKSLKVSIAEGSAYSVMEGFGLRYIMPYAIALGMSNFLIGLLSSLPGLLGSLSQLQSSKLVEKKSRKSIVFASVIFQIFTWLPIIAVGAAYFFFGLSSFNASIMLIIFYTLLTVFGSFAAPAWNSWMRDLISNKTDSYFARRNRIGGAIGLISAFIAGALLSYFQKKGTFYGFLVIFIIALAGRATSAYLFTKQYEPKTKKSKDYYFSFYQFIKKSYKNNFGMFVIFSTMISFSVAIASPFFTVYLLDDLKLSYLAYTIIVTVPIATTLLTLPFWGKFGDKYGSIKIIKICGRMIFLVPLFYIPTIYFSSNQVFLLTYLIVTEIFSGIIWAGFNLATGTFVFHAVTKERLPLCIAYSTILNAFGAFLGAALGGLISSKDFILFGLDSILIVFLISTIARFVFFFAFINKIKEVREVKNFKIKYIKKLVPEIVPPSLIENAGVKRIGHMFSK